jgi:hypothetical protein
MLDVPVLFCIFNRPELTRQVFERIRAARPKMLLVVSDGPRPDRTGEPAAVLQSRAVLQYVDWDCEVKTNFSDENLGCKARIATGITWAFEHAEELIILEDDCLPDPTFFNYCVQLLNRYRDNPQIMMISGNNFQPTSRTDASYYFSHWTHIWGWATWKRAWQHFDVDVQDWPQRRMKNFFNDIFPSATDQNHWGQVMDNQHAGLIDTWDFPWTYACWKSNGLTVLPDQNLVTNIGFGETATHTTDAESRLASLPAYPMAEIIHPDHIARHEIADQYTLENIMSVCSGKDEGTGAAAPRISRWKRLRNSLSKRRLLKK